ncbi:MAG TPA: hypothetical protein HPQ03_07630 [Deltaproteobacteria bacterium]|nr:hypothetical protein [Deltaproteobacteria bacterium]
MAEDNADNSRKSLWIIIICAGVVIIGVALALLLKDKPVPISETDQRTEKTVATQGSETTPASEQQPSTPSSKDSPSADRTAPSKEAGGPVVDYGKLKDDKELQAVMEKRKEKYGFEKGVDLIVKPDESVKVGDEVIPMREILEKIRLGRGEVIEKDLSESAESGVAAQKRYEEIEKLLKPSDKPESGPEQTKEKKIEQVVSAYKEYKATEEKIKEKKKLLEDLEAKKESLKSQQQIASSETTQQAEAPKTKSAPPKTATAFEESRKKPEEVKKPDTYIPIKPGMKQAIPKVAALPPTPMPQAGKTAPIPQIIGKDSTVTTSKEKSTESASPKPVPEIKKPEAGGIPVQKPVPSTKEMAQLEKYMKSIQDDINTLMLKKGDLESEIKQLLTEKKKPEAYGIYVVQNGDNIWDVHFAFLTEYFTSRGISLSRTADEPDDKGKSSGVGKILKFSENMVYIYNTRDRRLETDINMIHPLSKIVVFNMGQVFELLDRLVYRDIEKIEFDGENLWLPAES